MNTTGKELLEHTTSLDFHALGFGQPQMSRTHGPRHYFGDNVSQTGD